MKKLLYLLPVVTVLLLAGAGLLSAANAATTDDCQAKIDALRAQTATVELFGHNAEMDRAGLLGKLDEASAKLAEGKLDDAIQKLTDFRTRVEELAAAPKPKIGADDAAALIAGADDAIACIQSLQASTTTTTAAA